MKNIFTIFKKELIDTLRDKRTIIVMVIVPILVFPVLITLITKVQSSFTEKETTKVLNIGILGFEKDTVLGNKIANTIGLEVTKQENIDLLIENVQNSTLDVGVIIEKSYLDENETTNNGQISLYFRSIESSPQKRVEEIINSYSDEIVETRLSNLNVNEQILEPYEVKHNNLVEMQEMLGKTVGGMLPYIFILFCFTGAMYPAIDLFTGEKERKTIETLLTAPVSRLEILLGKLMVVSLTGILSAVLAIVGLVGGIGFTNDIPPEIMEVASSMISMEFILLLLVMLIPLTVFLGGILVPLTIYAKSFKEAQSIITPLTFVIIIPAIFGLLPGVELNATTAIIPIVNIALTTKEIMSGNISYGLFALTTLSLIVLAIISVIISARGFAKESNIIR